MEDTSHERIRSFILALTPAATGIRCDRHRRRRLGDGVHRRGLYLPLLPRAEDGDPTAGRDHGFTLCRPLDRQISLVSTGVCGRRRGGQPEFHGLGEDLKRRVRV